MPYLTLQRSYDTLALASLRECNGYTSGVLAVTLLSSYPWGVIPKQAAPNGLKQSRPGQWTEMAKVTNRGKRRNADTDSLADARVCYGQVKKLRWDDDDSIVKHKLATMAVRECKLCSKVLKLSNMGIEAIKSHESNAKHRGLAAVAFAAAPIRSFLQPSTFSSALDSEVAKNFSCSESKARYMATFGLAPYLLELLMDKVKDDCFVLLFDESLNKKVQQKQLDIYLRFWNGNEVQSRYFTFIFMGHARAVDIEEDLNKAEFAAQLKTCTQLSKVDLRDRSHHKQVDLGFSAEMYLQSAEFRKMKISDKDVLGIRISAKAALITFTEKVLEKSPMRYPLARSISCLDPHFIAQSPDAFLSSELLQFKPGQDRLDIFLHDKMCTPYRKLWMAVRMALLLSHGQATIERGFSVNKEVVIENQQTKSLIARRLIKDHIIQAGGILQVSITKQMMISVRSARSRYSQYLADKKECEVKERAQMKRKAELDEIEELKMKTKRLKSDIDALHISVKKYAEKCETTGDLTYIAKSNSLRRTADEKEEELKKVNEELDAKIEKYKQ
eukprot:Em0005g408a